MTEQELLNKIKESADQVEIPDSLTPERIAGSLHAPANIRHIFRFPARKTVSAAAVLLLCGILSAVAWNSAQISPDTGNSSLDSAMESAAENGADAIDATPAPADSGTEGSASEGQAEAETPKEEPKRDAGTLYTVAKSYNQVYDVLKSSYDMESKYRSSKEAQMEGEDIASDNAGEEATAEFSMTTGYDLGASSSAAQKSDYSSTNLQTEGVDESDIIKTDGRYIYTVTGSKLKITDTAGGELKAAGEIDTVLEASDHILEFYVDGSRLFLLVQHYDTGLTEETSYTSASDSGIIALTDCAKVDTIETKASAILYTYDITDPANPALTATTEQDGYYYTSRKIGDIIYLFTKQGLDANSKDGFVPCINKEEIPYNHIYVPDQGNDGFLISSVNVSDPGKTIDKVMLVHNSVNVYVATDAIYLYNTDYRTNDLITQIAKFTIEDGMINAVNAASVKGEIYDTFAINAYKDTLRILTTYIDQKGNTDNRLYLLDSDLQLTGSLDGIARGEEIYAARYFGNTAYFITYKNTDPLFAVDLTNPSDPVLLGELEITGFSDYLHFWGKDKLLGIGFETDPDSGERKGLKLVMFDISNPTDLKIIDTAVLKDSYYSPALYDYKCVLAEPEKNLIGFTAEHNPSNGSYYASYHIFSFENGRFQGKLAERLLDHEYLSYDSVRGIYIGDNFYIACPMEITSYDITQDFTKSGRIDLE